MKIVSGRTGTPHVTSQQFRQILEGTVGQGSYILSSGENLEPELVSNNLLKIRSGMMCHHGNVACVEIGTYDEVELINGSQGMKRIDLVVNRYKRNSETEIESNEWIVIQGTPVSSDPVVPSYTVGNLQDGDLVDDCPVIQITYDGLNVTEVKKLLTVVKNASEIENEIAELNSNLPEVSGSLSDWLFFKYPNGYIEAHRFYQFSGVACSTAAGGEYVSGYLWFGNTPSLAGATWNGGYGNAGFGSLSAGARFNRIYALNDNGAVRVQIASRTSAAGVNFPAHVVLTGTWK